MQRTFRLHRLALAVAVVAVSASALAALAFAGPQAPTVPERIDVPAGNKPFLVGHATGVQIYACTTPGAWTFVAPRATLVDDRGHFLTTHFGGPTWQAKDGSAVVAARVDGVTVDATAIPWLLLSATSTSAGFDGDRLAATTFIQRIATAGGLAPAAATCNESTAGTTVEIPYTADYVFWKQTG